MRSPWALRSASTLVALLLGLAVLVSCAGDGTTLDPLGVPLGPPVISVSPEELAISLVEGTERTVQITIANEGGFPLVVDAVVSPSGFLAPQFQGPATLPREASLVVDVVVTAPVDPAASRSLLEGALEISSNDEIHPRQTVSIRLEVTPAPEPEIDVAPLRLDLTVTEGEIDMQSITISNFGSADLIVDEISSPDAFLVPAIASVTIPPAGAESVTVTVRADLLAPGSHQGRIDVRSNDADEAFVSIPVALEVESAGPFPATLGAIQANVFDLRCAIDGCHKGPSAAIGMSLESGQTRRNLVGVESLEVPTLFRIEPENPDDSYLVVKVKSEDDPRRVLSQMPPFGELLPDDEVDVIRRWISEGAQDN